MPTRVHRLLSREQKAYLRHMAEMLERETGAEIAGVIVPHVDDVEGFATAYFNHLGLGKRGYDNGLLVLVVLDRHLVRIEVGRGLETVVPPDAADRIIARVIAPHFRRGAYGEGLVRGMEALADLVRKAAPSEKRLIL
jgi:uncharacterized protein